MKFAAKIKLFSLPSSVNTLKVIKYLLTFDKLRECTKLHRPSCFRVMPEKSI